MVAGSCECDDEPLGSSDTELVMLCTTLRVMMIANGEMKTTRKKLQWIILRHYKSLCPSRPSEPKPTKSRQSG
jgi:hypothetical protein